MNLNRNSLREHIQYVLPQCIGQSGPSPGQYNTIADILEDGNAKIALLRSGATYGPHLS